MRHGIRLTLAALALAALIPIVWAQLAGETIIVREPSSRDLYAAGREVELLAPVTGDAVLAGQRLSVSAPVSEDLIIAGETIRVTHAVGDDLRAAGREVSMEAPVGGHVAAAGQYVTIGSGVEVGDWAWLAGERLVVRGRIGEELRAAGQQVVIGGRIGGNAEVMGEHILVEASAVIAGDLIVRSEREPEIIGGARIEGRVINQGLPEEVGERDEGWGVSGALFMIVSVLIALLVLYWLFPGFLQSSAQTLTESPLKSLGAGLAVLLVTPLAVVLLVGIGIGFLVGLPLAAVYLITLLLGYLAGLFTLGEVVARRLGFKAATTGRRVLVLALTVVAVVLVSLIPLLGPLALLVLWLAGMGACLLMAYRASRAQALHRA